MATRARLTTFILSIFATFYTILFAFSFHASAFAEPGGFPVFYTAGILARHHLADLYSLHLQNIFHPASIGTGGYFYHPAYELLLLVPLSYLPQVPAFALWTACSLASLLIAAILLRRHFPSFPILTPFAFAPTLILLINGQDTALLVLITVLSLHQFLRHREFAAGAILALGLFKFPFVLPLIVILVFRHPRTLVGFITAAVPITLISVAPVGLQGIHQYITLAHTADTIEAIGTLTNLRGLIGTFTGAAHPILLIALSLSLVAYAASLKLTRAQFFSLALIVTFLVSWHSHFYDAVLLLIPMACFYQSKTLWIQWLPIFLLLTTPALILTPMHCYLLAIPLGLSLALLALAPLG